MGFKARPGAIQAYTSGMRPHVVRWLRSALPRNWDDASHAFVNLFVESARLDPYIHGHVEAVILSPLFMALGYALGRWL